jgi:ABC-type polysaccharide/polyol phosphate export permease
VATAQATVEQIGSRFPWPFFIVVVFWLAIIFASFGVFAPRNAAVIAVMFVAALGLSGAIFMILEMDQPYRGVVRIPSTSLRIALDQLGRS